MTHDAPRPSYFFDGHSNRRRSVELRVGDCLDIAEDGALITSWPYAGLRRCDSPSGLLRLASAGAVALARLDVRDPTLQAAILARLGHTAAPSLHSVASTRIIAWSLAAAAAIFCTVVYAVPFFADKLTDAIPLAWEDALGEIADTQIRRIFSGKICDAPDGVAAFEKLVAKLQSVAQLPIAPKPVVLQSGISNAMALPGGRVYVLSTLLEVSVTPDELAGVLAHEFGHVAHRDGMRRLIRQSANDYLVGVLFGDVTGAGAALFLTQQLLNSAYSRDVEGRADQFAITIMLQLGRPTTPLGDLLDRMAAGRQDTIALLASHPVTPARVAVMAQASRLPTQPPLLDSVEWKALKAICK